MQLKKQAIFIDQEQSEDIENWAPLSGLHSESDLDAYITQFLAPSVLIQDSILQNFTPIELSVCETQARDSNVQNFRLRKAKQKQIGKSIKSRKKLRKQVKNQFEHKFKRERPTDHNMCKKLHTFANKCLRKLKLYQLIKPQSKKIHKRNYFLFVLVVVQKTRKLQLFKKIYQLKVEQVASKCRKSLSNAALDLGERKQCEQMLEAIGSSLAAIELFSHGDVHEALLKMFKVDKLKRLEWIQQAFAQVLSFGERIQPAVERVLTRF